MAKIQAGELDRQVTLYSSSTAQDSLGQAIVSWSSQGAVWAIVHEQHGTESVRGDEQSEDKPITVIIRGGSGVQTGWKLAYDSQDYRIVSVRRMGRDHWDEIKATRIGASESGD